MSFSWLGTAPAVLFGWNSGALVFILIPLFWLLTWIGWWSLELLLMLPSLLQLSSKGYNNWISCSSYSFDVLILAAYLTWSFSQYIFCAILIFQVFLFLSFHLFVTASPTLILNSFALCVILCRSHKAVTDSLFHLFQAGPLPLASYFCLLFQLPLPSSSGYSSMPQFFFQATYYCVLILDIGGHLPRRTTGVYLDWFLHLTILFLVCSL